MKISSQNETLSAQDAQMRGEPTVLEGMQLLYARVEWAHEGSSLFLV